MNTWSLTLQLRTTPFATPSPADARTPPFRAIDDYAAMNELAHPSTTPILLGYGQFYQLIERLVAQARTLQFDAPVLLEVTRPLGVPVPESLLRADVLIADRIDDELAYWLRTARRGVFAARVRLRREPHEYGGNRLSLLAGSRIHESDPLPAFLHALGRASAWQTLDCDDAAASWHSTSESRLSP
ncbi:hypothetical protein [Tahibacter amnicola]|uniref:Uncharacterized protein n=1 Tax=Tahibacter amnicola TaxID=2976241 RepID=A0ABY6BAL1_9GAMM|nr:hypothetical protein [Tahibacter amnicola]UXI66185.1 hypothetical protein N4264_15660 [Tahibacter amnicola]